MTEEYYSCEWIEGGLSFNRRSLHSCLIVHNNRGYPKYLNYNGGSIKVEEILESREIIKNKHKQGDEHEACKGCPHLKKKKWSKPEYDFDILGIAHYSHCNIKCNYCFLQTQPRSSFQDGFKPFKISEQIEFLFDSGKLSPNSIIDWGGGEPTIYKEFETITSSSLDKGAFHFLHSNGVRFPTFLLQHNAAKNLHIICSVDAGTSGVYKQIKGVDYLNSVWASLEKYVEAECKVTLKYIITEQNASKHELEQFLKRAKALVGYCDLIIDIDYNISELPSEVINGLSYLHKKASEIGIVCRFGFTGANFSPDSDANKYLNSILDFSESH